MSVARSFGSTEATKASKMGSRCEPRSSAPASSELKAMAPSGAGASMITMRSSLVMASTELSLSNCWQMCIRDSLNGTGEPLITVTVPQDIYTSASATLGSAQFTCVSYDSSENETWTSTFSDMGVPAANVTVSLAAPITVSGKGMGLSLDLLVTQSASWGTCDSSGVNGPYSITPSFNLTPVAIAAQRCV